MSTSDTATILTSLAAEAEQGKLNDLLLIADVEGAGMMVTTFSVNPGGSTRLVGLLEMLKYHYIYSNLPEK